MKRHGLLFVLVLLAMVGAPFAVAQTATITVFSKTTVEADGLMAECSTDVTGIAVGLYQKVRTICAVTKDETRITDDLDCQSEPFFPFHSFATPDLKADCKKSLSIPIAGGARYKTEADHYIYFAAEVFGPGTPFTDPCHIRVFFLGNVPHTFVIPCPFDATPVAPNSFWHLGSTLDYVTTTTLEPAETTLGPRQEQQFTSQPATNAVVWSITPQIGTIDQSGKYLAPDTILQTQTVNVTACHGASDCGHATVTLVPVSVVIVENNPQKLLEVLPLGGLPLHALVSPPGVSQSVKFELDPDDPAVGILEQTDFASADFIAGANNGPHSATVTACSTVDELRLHCDSLTVFIPFVTISMTADHNPLNASPGAQAALSVTVGGTTQNSIQWFPPDPSGPGIFVSNGPTATYTIPSPAVNLPAQVTFKACLAATIGVCTSLPLVLSQPVAATVGPATWPAGQNTAVTITGTGFGAQPAVRISDPRILFTQTGLTVSPAGSTIQGTISVPLLLDGETAVLTVTNTSIVPPIQTTILVPILPANVAVAVGPSAVTMQEGQSRIFTFNGSCLTATGVPCALPQPSWSINPAVGSIDQNGLYTAPAVVAAQQTVTVSACITSSSSRCGSAAVTLVPVPKASLSPATLDFGGLVPGTAAPARTMLLTNTGSLPLQNISIAASGSSDFKQTNSCGSVLAAGANCTITITFTPTSPGGRTGTLTVTSNAANGPLTGSFSGIGLYRSATLTSISPNNVTVGSSGFTLSVFGANFVVSAVVSVNGSGRPTTFVSTSQLRIAISSTDVAALGALAITAANPTPGGGGMGSVLLTTTTTPIPLVSNVSPARVIAGNPTFTLLVNGNFFSPDSAVQIAGNSRATQFISPNQLKATILSTDVTSSGLVQISVSSLTSGLAATAAQLAVFRYGDLNFDNSVSVQDLSALANVLAGNSVLPDRAAGDLDLDGTLNSTDLTILANRLAGNVSALPVMSDQTAFLFNAGATVVLSPPTFGGQTVGVPSDPMPLKLTNGGPTPLSISGIQVTGDFTEADNCGSVLAANQSCIINVIFTPTVAGSRTGTLTVRDNATNGPQTASLSGFGIASASTPTAALSRSGAAGESSRSTDTTPALGTGGLPEVR